MFHIKKAVLKLHNLMVAYDKSFKAIQTKTQPIQNQQYSKTIVLVNFLSRDTCWP